ncbi:F-box/WD repeat-containing protein 5 isoform X1 [Carcharodon carcharias]|uniref:F-box/WD repeat-containing protein 5 isoform X1 n=1 Tax=Carcharodon carcharias TaxID=13397 RepID=UPI001B7F4B67|nr:F-box/WD repeat-containing protein 5 isoform X1 [Carcharodon carcharias]XP_041049054.1 F-box/WD repeat-containing protein 5 isoform X1 [Carcharodon carcharias]
MEGGGLPRLPDTILLEVFLKLEHQDVLAAGTTCRQWYRVSRDEFLWKDLFYCYYNVNRSVPRHPAAVSWLGEFQRLYDTIPCVQVETLKEHRDQVLHVSFSHNGYLFGSCSKDCFVKVWNNDLEISVLHSANMRPYNWSYTQFSQFNAEDTLLLVSGVYIGPHSSSSGEIAVFSLDDFTLLSRVRNKPYDVFGCWLNETHLISGNLHWIGNMTSCSVLWLNKAYQDIESENINVVKRLFQLQNLNASTIRTVIVADCSRHNSPDLLLGSEEQLTSPTPQVFDLGDSEDEVCSKLKHRSENQGEVMVSSQADERIEENVLSAGGLSTMDEKQIEARVAELFLQAKTKPADMALLSEQQTTQDKKYLIFTTGSLTYTPHQIGIKQILPHHMTTSGPVLGEERSSNEFFDALDYTIDVHGHIIGMGLSPDHRYLYVNSRAWPKGCIISDPMNPPPIAEEIDIHVFDLKTMQEVTQTLRAHTAYTPNDECFFIFLDVSRDYVASGAEDRHGYIWDRHYNICLAKLQHEDVVNSVAFSPVDQEMLITASDDCTLKVWRSPRILRIISAKPNRKKFSFFWLNNKK